jgi:uncharacterized protein (TIGR01777 family)
MVSSRLACSHLVSGSAIGYYGSRGDDILDEASLAGTDFLATLCVEWEEAANSLVATGATVSFLRTGIVLTQKGGALKKQLPLFRWGVGGALGTGHQWMSPISLDDEVRAILYSLDHKLTGPLNLVCPTPLTNAQFTRALASQLRRPAFFRVPPIALNLVLGSELVNEAILASQRIVPTRLLESGFVFHARDVPSALQSALGR